MKMAFLIICIIVYQTYTWLKHKLSNPRILHNSGFTVVLLQGSKPVQQGRVGVVKKYIGRMRS